MVSGEVDSKQLLKALEKLPINIQKNIMVGSTRASARVVANEAKRLVPVRFGNLKRSIGLIKRRSKRGEVIFSVTPRKGGKYDGFYGRFVELGTSKMNPKPFLRPALESQVEETLKVSKDYIAKRLPQEVAKARK